ncbi:hypothetical protein T07_6921 [Trichinella nelsoni]|uniref:Uncharacterized protein n=1 Tax=Trichinella nelsoni TaxID=6336 RepID=A0A0V0SDI6_9BILA|nr:hypothetical protein T07_6921 [Trichinella nelsoni]
MGKRLLFSDLHHFRSLGRLVRPLLKISPRHHTCRPLLDKRRGDVICILSSEADASHHHRRRRLLHVIDQIEECYKN